MESLFALLPPKTAQEVVLGIAVASAVMNLVRFFVPNGSRAAAVLDKGLGLLVDLHKAFGTSAHANAPATTKKED